MAKIDVEFQALCNKILEEGKPYENKNRGVERLQIPSYTIRHDLKDGFPAITSKKLWFKAVVGELIWFLRGDNDVKYLNENGIDIWNKDAFNWHKIDCPMPMQWADFNEIGIGSVGQNYGVQWRKWNGKVDQIALLLEGMRKDIMSSRLIVNAWNASELDQTALPPCHDKFQIVGVPLENGRIGFELHWNQRSVDVFLGLPFNIASYALLAHIIGEITGFEPLAIEGNLHCVHFYDNQYEEAKKLVEQDPEKHKNCRLVIKDAFPVSKGSDGFIEDWHDVFRNLEISSFKLDGYTSEDAVKVPMLAPKELGAELAANSTPAPVEGGEKIGNEAAIAKFDESASDLDVTVNGGSQEIVGPQTQEQKAATHKANESNPNAAKAK